MNNVQTIAVAGAILVDKINQIKAYPKIGELTQIQKVSVATGGCVPNVAINLKRILPTLNVKAVGRVGNDQEGRFAVKEMQRNGVITDDVKVCADRTSFTEVMSVTGGQRTFFTYAGANSEFCYEDIDFTTLDAQMLHLGYLLLLEKIDQGDGVKILKKAVESGIKTSIDLVSENSDRYSLVLPCLKYTDNLIINETEGGNLTGINPSENNLLKIARTLKDYGVRERVIIHTPTQSVCCSETGCVTVASLDIPSDMIKGTTGAGDAFCAGALVGIAQGKTDTEILSFAAMSAVCSLTEQDATSGIKSKDETIEFCKNLKRKELF